MENQWNNTTRYIVGIGLFVFGIFVLYLIRPVLPILTIAALIAFLINPLVSFFTRKFRFPNWLALLLSYSIGFLLILLSPLLFLSPIVNAINFFLGLNYQNLLKQGINSIRDLLLVLKTYSFHIMGINLVLDHYIDQLLTILSGTNESFVLPELPSVSTIVNSLFYAFSRSSGVAIGVFGYVITGFVGFFLLIISSIYLVKDGKSLLESVLSLAPNGTREEINLLLHLLKSTWESFFRGQITLMVIIGVIVWISTALLGLPGAVSLGVIAGLMEILPNIGPVIATIPAVLVALIMGSTYLPISNWALALIVIGLYIIIQLLENSVIVPNVMGESVKLHPLVIIIGVIVGTSTWGVLGALLAAPVIASIKIIFLYLYRKVIGDDPFKDLAIYSTPHKPINNFLNALDEFKHEKLEKLDAKIVIKPKKPSNDDTDKK